MMNGLYSEYNAEWCKHIGALICSTMLYKVAWPVVEFVSWYLIRGLYRMIDKGRFCWQKKTETSCKTIQEYESIYSGP